MALRPSRAMFSAVSCTKSPAPSSRNFKTGCGAPACGRRLISLLLSTQYRMRSKRLIHSSTATISSPGPPVLEPPCCEGSTCAPAASSGCGSGNSPAAGTFCSVPPRASWPPLKPGATVKAAPANARESCISPISALCGCGAVRATASASTPLSSAGVTTAPSGRPFSTATAVPPMVTVLFSNLTSPSGRLTPSGRARDNRAVCSFV